MYTHQHSFIVNFFLAGTMCRDGFVDTETFQRNSMFLGEFSPFEGRVQWIFPYLNFTCDTTITSFKIVARKNAFNNVYPALQVWRPVRGVGFARMHEIMADNLSLVSKYRSHFYRSPRLSVSVERGDVIGYYQPNIQSSRFSLYFQTESGFSALKKSNELSAPGSFRTRGGDVESNVQDFPLLHVIAGRALIMQTQYFYLDMHEIQILFTIKIRLFVF